MNTFLAMLPIGHVADISVSTMVAGDAVEHTMVRYIGIVIYQQELV